MAVSQQPNDQPDLQRETGYDPYAPASAQNIRNFPGNPNKQNATKDKDRLSKGNDNRAGEETEGLVDDPKGRFV